MLPNDMGKNLGSSPLSSLASSYFLIFLMMFVKTNINQKLLPAPAFSLNAVFLNSYQLRASNIDIQKHDTIFVLIHNQEESFEVLFSYFEAIILKHLQHLSLIKGIFNIKSIHLNGLDQSSKRCS